MNVWEKRHERHEAAVLVWIHGGGFISGSKGDLSSNAHMLDAATQEKIEDSIIFVSINYRLGAFGWLGGDEAFNAGIMPNVGLKDQEFAIAWVNDNIHLFGGNNSKITLMGFSAGASSIMHHITSSSDYPPKFRSAIIQSPAFIPSPNLTKADQTYRQFMSLACAKDLEDLLQADTKDLMQVNADMSFNSSYGLFAFGPMADDSYVRKLPAIELGNGNYRGGTSLMVGHAKFDGLLFTPHWVRTNTQLRDYIRTVYSGVSEQTLGEIEKRYPIADPATAQDKVLGVISFLNDIGIQCNTYYLTKAMLAYGGRHQNLSIYRYAFNTAPAIHGFDLHYTFYPCCKIPASGESLARFMQSAVANFTTRVDPNNVGSDFWPMYSDDNKKVINIGNPEQLDVPDYGLSVGEDIVDANKCEFWRPAPYYEPKEH